MTRKRSRTRLAVDERRDQLIALGRRIFAARPYDEISIDDIAEAAGISKGLLYHYFSSKRRFYVETVRASFAEMRRLTEPNPSLPPIERLEASLDAYLDYIARNGKSYENMIRSGIGADPEVVALIEAERKIVLDRVLASLGIVDAPPAIRMAIRGWIGFIDAVCLDWVQHDEDVTREAARTLLSSSLHAALVSAVQLVPDLQLELPVFESSWTTPTSSDVRATAPAPGGSRR
jgi:AcrR family transcriptional regulator